MMNEKFERRWMIIQVGNWIFYVENASTLLTVVTLLADKESNTFIPYSWEIMYTRWPGVVPQPFRLDWIILDYIIIELIRLYSLD